MSTYTVVTPVRDDAANLRRLAACMDAQTKPFVEWLIVDNGSPAAALVETRAIAARSRARLIQAPPATRPGRSQPIVRSFHVALSRLSKPVDVVVKLDADLSFEPDYFERLLGAFDSDPRLGIASGICLERIGGEWRPLYGTRSHVWGAARAYRRFCLEQVLPLEEHEGWDEIDAIKAQLRGWHVGTLFDLPFRHHRPEGNRDGQLHRWRSQGEAAHYMGYRSGYLAVRALYRARRDPRALALLWGYAVAAIGRRPRCGDADVRRFLRREQSLVKLLPRMREARGRAAA